MSALNRKINEINAEILALIDANGVDLEYLHVDYELYQLQYVGEGVPGLFDLIIDLVDDKDWMGVNDGDVVMQAASNMVEVEIAERVFDQAISVASA